MMNSQSKSTGFVNLESEEIKMNEEIVVNEKIVDITCIKNELIKLAIMKHTGMEPTKQLINKFSKYLIMEYENNTSKNSLDNRLHSLCNAITKKYDKYTRISQL